MTEIINYYNILQVSNDASKDTIKKSFRKLSLELHPDKNQGNIEKADQFKTLAEAYATLSNDDKRKRYDLYGIGADDGQSINPMDFENLMKEVFADGGSELFGGFLKSFSNSYGAPPGVFEFGFNISSMQNLEVDDIIKGMNTLSDSLNKYKDVVLELGLNDIINGCSRVVGIEGKKIRIKLHRGIPNHFTFDIPNAMGIKVKGRIKYNLKADENENFYIDDKNDINVTLPITLIEYFCGFNKKIMIGPRELCIVANGYFNVGDTMGIRNKGLPIYKKKDRYSAIWIKFQIDFPQEKIYNQIRKFFVMMTESSTACDDIDLSKYNSDDLNTIKVVDIK
jgi:DnaJ-class molecular chaperone